MSDPTDYKRAYEELLALYTHLLDSSLRRIIDRKAEDRILNPLSRKCPVCDREPGQSCIDVDGWGLKHPHTARALNDPSAIKS